LLFSSASSCNPQANMGGAASAAPFLLPAGRCATEPVVDRRAEALARNRRHGDARLWRLVRLVQQIEQMGRRLDLIAAMAEVRISIRIAEADQIFVGI